MGHLQVDGERLGAFRPVKVSLDALDAGIQGAQHHREDGPDAGGLEGRVHQPAVALPCLPVGDEDAVAGEGPQHVVHQHAFGEVLGPGHQNFADQFRRAHGE